MATIHFVGGEKGGIGKSVVSRLLAQYMIDRGIAFRAFDTDRSHGSLLRFYAGYATPVLIDRCESLDGIVEAAVESPEKRILVDLAAQTYEPWARWMEESGVLELAGEAGIEVRYWNVMDSGRDSVDLLGKLLRDFGSRLGYVLVLNQVRDSGFDLFENSPEKALATELQAATISVRHLHDATLAKVDSSSSSFWSAQNQQDKAVTGLGLLDRQRLKIWLRHAYAEFERVGV